MATCYLSSSVKLIVSNPTPLVCVNVPWKVRKKGTAEAVGRILDRHPMLLRWNSLEGLFSASNESCLMDWWILALS